jgi:hypothetical protein
MYAASGYSGAYDCGNTSLGVDSPAGDLDRRGRYQPAVEERGLRQRIGAE